MWLERKGYTLLGLWRGEDDGNSGSAQISGSEPGNKTKPFLWIWKGFFKSLIRAGKSCLERAALWPRIKLSKLKSDLVSHPTQPLQRVCCVPPAAQRACAPELPSSLQIKIQAPASGIWSRTTSISETPRKGSEGARWFLRSTSPGSLPPRYGWKENWITELVDRLSLHPTSPYSLH